MDARALILSLWQDCETSAEQAADVIEQSNVSISDAVRELSAIEKSVPYHSQAQVWHRDVREILEENL